MPKLSPNQLREIIQIAIDDIVDDESLLLEPDFDTSGRNSKKEISLAGAVSGYTLPLGKSTNDFNKKKKFKSKEIYED
jgi:hypothetical protein